MTPAEIGRVCRFLLGTHQVGRFWPTAELQSACGLRTVQANHLVQQLGCRGLVETVWVKIDAGGFVGHQLREASQPNLRKALQEIDLNPAPKPSIIA